MSNLKYISAVNLVFVIQWKNKFFGAKQESEDYRYT